MENTIKKENYNKFIQLARQLDQTNVREDGDGPEMWTFDLEGIARIVDIAYCEGQIKEMTRDDSYAEDADKIKRFGALQTQIENAMPEDFVEILD